MNITFLIGNGFDIGLGLRTSYENFYKEYCKINPYEDNSNIQNFKKLLENRSNDKYYGIRDWSDFEKAFGEHAEDFLAATKDLYIERFEDFVKAFNKYLEDEEQKANLSDKDSLAEFMKRGINTYYHIREADKNIFQNIYDRNSTERKYNFVSFNYTRILDVCARELDNLLKKEKAGLVGQVIHVHGYIDESMIMGVNDSSQIKKPDLAKDADILMEMVKPQQNIDSRTTYDIKTTDIILKNLLKTL